MKCLDFYLILLALCSKYAFSEIRGEALYSSNATVYQSALHQPIVIYGSNFSNDLSFDTLPPLQVGVDYILKVKSPTQAVLKLLPGKMWRASPGDLTVRRLRGASYDTILPGDGICVAKVLADPAVFTASLSLNEHLFESLTITGAGFTNFANTKLTVIPFHPEALRVREVLNDRTLLLELLPGAAWHSEGAKLKRAKAGTELELIIMAIDTGAGVVTLDPPVATGFVLEEVHYSDDDGKNT